MPFKIVSSSAQATGAIEGVPMDFNSPAVNTLIADGDILVTVALTPAKGFWDDYETAPLTYTMTITNGEGAPYTGPISVEVGDFDITLVEYVTGSIASMDNTVENASYDDSTGKLTFDLTEDIVATTGVATITFQMQKVVTP